MEKREKEIDEMVALIESLRNEGSMHVNVQAAGDSDEVRVSTAITNECAGGACMQPTEKEELSELKREPEKEEE